MKKKNCYSPMYRPVEELVIHKQANENQPAPAKLTAGFEKQDTQTKKERVNYVVPAL